MADKVCKLVTIPGGVELVAVVPGLRREVVLSAQQLVELTQLAQQVEAQLGYPVELECAYKDEAVYLLQCQPLYPRRFTSRGENACPSNPVVG